MRYTEFKIDEAPMNPGEYNKAIDTGHTQGVLVGYEFEVCMPEETLNNFQGDTKVTTAMVDDKLKENQGYLFGNNLSRMTPDRFMSMFKLKPGISNYTSTDEAIKAVLADRIKDGKALFNKVPVGIRKKAMEEMHADSNASPMAFLADMGYLLYYKFDGQHDAGGDSKTEEIGAKMRSLVDVRWMYILNKMIPRANLQDSSHADNMSQYFDFNPQAVFDELGMEDSNDAGAFTVLKPSLEKTMNAKVNVFHRYHQSSKNMTDWYIEPDGSLRPDNRRDFTAEVVSPPLPAKDAVQALKNFFALASQLKLYTNESTGLHINVSIPATIDLMKLAVFTGDQHILQKYGRMDNDYAASVTRDIPTKISNRNSVVRVADIPGKNVFGQQKKTTTINYKELKDIADDISANHTASISSNGKWISFRHVGGNYLKDYNEIFNVVGRFVRAVIIASDPSLYKNEYATAVAKLTGANTANTGGSLMSNYIKKKGLPAAEFYIATTDPNFDTALKNVIIWQSFQRSALVISPVTETEYAKNLLTSRARPDGPYKKWVEEHPETKFATCTIYPKDESAAREISYTDPVSRVEVLLGGAGGKSYFTSKTMIIPAGDQRVRKYLLLLRKQK